MLHNIFTPLRHKKSGAIIISLAIMIVGLTVISGWATQNITLITILPNYPAMVFNTALGFVLCAVGLLCAQMQKTSITVFFGSLGFLMGAANILEYGLGINFGIDELFFQDFVKSNVNYPGRMSISTALCFVLTGGSLTFLTLAKRLLTLSVFVEILCAFGILLPFISLLDHFDIINTGYNWFLWQSMAVHTALSFMALNGVILSNLWKERVNTISIFNTTAPAFFLVLALLFDAYTPHGIAAGFAYMPFVLCSISRPNMRAPFIFAGVATCLIIFGFYASIHVETPWMNILINRGVSIIGIWMITVLIYGVKLQENALKENAERLNAVVDNMVDGLITINERGHIESFNMACERIFGYRGNEVIGQNVKMLMPEPYHSEHDGYLKNYHDTGERKIIGIGREVEGQKKDSTVFPIDLSISEINLQGRKIYSGIVQDVSERKYAEEELISIGRVLEESLNEIFIFDSNTLQFMQVNKGARGNLGYDMEELKTMTPVDIKPEYSEEMFYDAIAPLKDSQKDKIIFETVHRRKDGTDYDVEVHLQMSRYQGKKAYVAMIRDISDRKKAEKEIIRSNEELERFAYIASHDLQEPLRMVASFTALLDEEYSENLDEQANEYMKFITDAARRMQALVGDLLEYSRVGQEDGGFTDVDCKAQTDIAINNLQKMIQETNANVTVDDLPIIYVNPVRFSRLIQNLIGNAIKYRQKDRPPEITVKAEDQGGEWLFSISDNGIGMKDEYLEQIFVIFKRLHNKKHYQGTGIGLAVSKRIVEEFDGRIWAESKLGKGSTFYFTVPKKEAARKAA